MSDFRLPSFAFPAAEGRRIAVLLRIGPACAGLGPPDRPASAWRLRILSDWRGALCAAHCGILRVDGGNASLAAACGLDSRILALRARLQIGRWHEWPAHVRPCRWLPLPATATRR